MFKNVFFISFLLFLFSVGCARPEKKSEKFSSEKVPVGRYKGKVTPPKAEENALRMGIRIKVINQESKSQGIELAKEFEQQIGVFETCVKNGKGQVFKVEARWGMSPEGVIDDFAVLNSMSKTKEFVPCFTKQIKRLQFKSRPVRSQGELEFITYWGTVTDWQIQGQKYLQK